MRLNNAAPALAVPDWMALPPSVIQNAAPRWDEVDVSTPSGDRYSAIKKIEFV